MVENIGPKAAEEIELESFEIHFTPRFGVCWDYKPNPLMTKTSKVTSWLYPHILEREGDRIRVHWSCSKGETCYADCRQAKGRG